MSDKAKAEDKKKDDKSKGKEDEEEKVLQLLAQNATAFQRRCVFSSRNVCVDRRSARKRKRMKSTRTHHLILILS